MTTPLPGDLKNADKGLINHAAVIPPPPAPQADPPPPPPESV